MNISNVLKIISLVNFIGEVVLHGGMHDNERVCVLEPGSEPQDCEEEVEKLVFLNISNFNLLDLRKIIIRSNFTL